MRRCGQGAGPRRPLSRDRLSSARLGEQQVADCRAVMRHLGVERAHFAGQSGGGQIILQLALDAPDAVHSLALLEPALPSVLWNSPQFGAMAEKAASLYESGNKAAAVEAFAKEVGGPDFRA